MVMATSPLERASCFVASDDLRSTMRVGSPRWQGVTAFSGEDLGTMGE
jgi:hypothetical protein